MDLLSWPQYWEQIFETKNNQDGGNWEVVKWVKLKSWSSKVNSVSLMLSLFC